MEKSIVRTIITYKHTFGTATRDENGNLAVEIVYEATLPDKLGQRKVKQYIQENNLPKEAILMSVEEVAEKYAMPLDAFLKNAVKV